MKKLFFGVFLVSVIFILGCKPYYLATGFDSKTVDHKTVAILPFEIIFTGKIPEELSPEEIVSIEEAEAMAFQMSFFQEVLNSTRGGKKQIRVDLQHYYKTNEILVGEDIRIHDSWQRSPEDLAGILGVDAVIRARIVKTRFMSDLTSFGIDVGLSIVNAISNYSFSPFLPGMVKSKEIDTEYSLFDKSDGTTLWSITFGADADWRSPANEIIDDINRRAAKKFPYRIK